MLGSVLVTGGAQRIGRAICVTLHKRGYRILIHYRHSIDEANGLEQSLNALRSGSAKAVQADLADQAGLEYLAHEVLESSPDLVGLVNNASAFFPQAFESTRLEQWDELMSANARAPYFLSQKLQARLAENAGGVVNLVDIHARHPLRNYSAYCASKSALESVTRSLALELAPRIRVNGVSPGAILWPEEETEEFSTAAKDSMLNAIPMLRLGEPEDIARVTAFLLCDADYVTGQVLAVDGGRSLAV